MEPGLRTFLRQWDPTRLADLPGTGARATYLLRMRFLDIVDELFPEVLVKLAALHERRSRHRPLPALPDAEIADILGAHHLSAVWIRAAARTTLQVWATRDERPTREWYAEAHTMSEVERNEMGSDPLEWNVLLESESELRERFEAFVRRRKEETFRAGYAQVSWRKRRPSRVSVPDRLRMLALHVVGGMTYRAIADEFAGGFGGRRVELSESAVQQHIANLASAIELPLPSRRGRRSTTSCRAIGDECPEDLGGGPVELSQSEVQQIAKLAGRLKLLPLTKSRVQPLVAKLGAGL